VEDPDTWYEFRYTTGNSPVTGEELASTPAIDPPTGNPNVRLLKVVNGKWKLLAEADNDTQSAFVIPAINAAGDDNGTGATFRFVAKGSLLQGFVSTDGKTFTKVLEATDDELKAGLVGLDHYDYNPVFDNLLVENAP
jgi:hypothetical protein